MATLSDGWLVVNFMWGPISKSFTRRCLFPHLLTFPLYIEQRKNKKNNVFWEKKNSLYCTCEKLIYSVSVFLIENSIFEENQQKISCKLTNIKKTFCHSNRHIRQMLRKKWGISIRIAGRIIKKALKPINKTIYYYIQLYFF